MAKDFNLANDSMKVVYGFLGIVLLLLFSAYLLPEVMNATTTISQIGITNFTENATGVGSVSTLPLANLFSGGIIVMIIVVVVIVAVIKNAGKIAK